MRLSIRGTFADLAESSAQTTGSEAQRNVDQQQRIVNGAEARAGANGHVGDGEQKSIQARENRQSRHVHNKKHNGNGSATGQNG